MKKASARHARRALALPLTLATLPGLIGIQMMATPAANADPDASSTTSTTTALPNTTSELNAKLSEVSREAEATSDQVSELEDKLSEANKTLSDAQAEVDAKKAAAQSALDAAAEVQKNVDSISLARYRRISVDPTTAYIGALNPQDAIDRAAYMNALSTDANKTVDDLQTSLKAADAARDDAARAQAVAKISADELEYQKSELQKKQADLKKLTNDIKAKVDSLTGASRQSWVNKNNPVELSSSDLAASSAGNAAVAAALTKLGAPYSWGATGPNAFDCSGLVVWAFRQAGKSLPRTSQAQMASGSPVSKGDLQPGDVVGFYPGATHVGIYIGNGRIVHASDYGIPVQVVSLNSMPWYGARRY